MHKQFEIVVDTLSALGKRGGFISRQTVDHPLAHFGSVVRARATCAQ